MAYTGYIRVHNSRQTSARTLHETTAIIELVTD